MDLTRLLIALTVFCLLFCLLVIVGAGIYALAWRIAG